MRYALKKTSCGLPACTSPRVLLLTPSEAPLSAFSPLPLSLPPSSSSLAASVSSLSHTQDNVTETSNSFTKSPPSSCRSLLQNLDHLRLDVGPARALDAACIRNQPAPHMWGNSLCVDLSQEDVEIVLRGKLSEGGEALVVKESVVRKVHKHLGGSGVGPAGSEGDPALGVALELRVVHDVGAILVERIDLRSSLQAPLHHKVVGIAEESSSVIEVVHDQAVEPVGTLAR
eukprot:763989-Hanusia_phi.AAC.6